MTTWKGNVGLSEVEDIEVTGTASFHVEFTEISDTYKLWMKECSQVFGGLDIFSLG